MFKMGGGVIVGLLNDRKIEFFFLISAFLNSPPPHRLNFLPQEQKQ